MSKVEELIDRLEAHTSCDKGHDWLHDTLLELVTLATDDGYAATKMLWTRMQKWNKEWQKENLKERSMTLLDAMDLIEWKIASAREEGRAEERERIACGSQRFPKGEYVVDSDYISMVFSRDGIGEAMTDCELFIIPASVLAPAPKEGGK